MKVVITGGGGFVGRRLVKQLADAGAELVLLARRPEALKTQFNGLPNVSVVAWEATRDVPAPAVLNGADAAINLAGESVAGRRWTAAVKQGIHDSRVLGTRHLVVGLEKALLPAHFTLISASAIGYYGDRGEEVLDESSAPGDDFLARVCLDWEAEAKKFSRGRVVIFRVSVVLGLGGGILGQLVPVFKAGLGGPVGSGHQWMGWIHEQDLVGLLQHAVSDPSLSGVYNAVGGEPVTNAHFAKSLGKALHRPAVLKAPVFGVKLILGEMAQAALGSNRVVSKRLPEVGYQRLHPQLDEALQSLLAR